MRKAKKFLKSIENSARQAKRKIMTGLGNALDTAKVA